MGELSRFWTTNGTGDGAAGGYTQAQFAEFVRQTLMTDTATEGVLKGIGGELAVTSASGSVNVATGSGLVYGLFYANDATVNISVTNTAASSRIDRIVLRANLSATTGDLPQTIRIKKSDGVAGTGVPPALVQSPTGIFEIPLATVTVSAGGGTITVADARTFVKTPGTYGYLDDANIIGTTQILSGAVTADKLASSAATEAKIATGAVTADKIGSGAVTSGKIGANAVVSGKIAADAVTTAAILNGTVTADKIVSSAVTEAKIATGAVTADKIGSSAVITTKIANEAVTNDKLGPGAVTASKIATTAVTGGAAGNIALSTITADNIVNSTITGAKIANTTITDGNILAGTITGAKIAGTTITAANIAAYAITSVKISTGAVGTDAIASSSVTGLKLADNAVSSAKILADNVTGIKLGDYAPKFGGRQGGHPNDWYTAGTTGYTNPISSVNGNQIVMSAGSIGISLVSATSGTANITFFDADTGSATYASGPIVICTPNGAADYIIDVSSVSTSGATIRATHKAGTSATTTVTVWWLSIGSTVN